MGFNTIGVRKFSLILRLLLATSIVIGLIPAQAIAQACAPQPSKSDCHTKAESCCKPKKSCGCEISSKSSPEHTATLSTAPQVQSFAILSEPISTFEVVNPKSDAQIPEQKANAPPGCPPQECASRAPPVNL